MQTMSSATMSVTGFTTDFVDRIGQSRRSLDDFVRTNQEQADSLVADFERVRADEQRAIDSLLRELRSLRHERGVAKGGAGEGVAERREKLEREEKKLEQEVSILKAKNRVEQERLDEVLAEEEAVRKKADEVRAKKEEIEMARGITIQDLTKGLLNYRYTGLSFARGDKEGALNFKFIKLDPEDHERTFTFTLSMDENNDYMLTNVNPPLDQNETDPILGGLNSDGKNGFNSFVVGMRKLFKDTTQ
ncbi:hypothetical protein ACHAWF_004157 [Thalassiosira exigua]